MKYGMQKILAKNASISDGHLSDIIRNRRRPSWQLAKRLAGITGTSPVLWLEGTTEEIRAALSDDSAEPKPVNNHGKWTGFIKKIKGIINTPPSD